MCIFSYLLPPLVLSYLILSCFVSSILSHLTLSDLVFSEPICHIYLYAQCWWAFSNPTWRKGAKRHQFKDRVNISHPISVMIPYLVLYLCLKPTTYNQLLVNIHQGYDLFIFQEIHMLGLATGSNCQGLMPGNFVDGILKLASPKKITFKGVRVSSSCIWMFFSIQSFETSASKVLEYLFFGRFQGVWFCWKMNVKKISQHKKSESFRFSMNLLRISLMFFAKDNTLPLGKRTEMVKDILKDAPRRLVREVLMEMDEDFSWGFFNSTVDPVHLGSPETKVFYSPED